MLLPKPHTTRYHVLITLRRVGERRMKKKTPKHEQAPDLPVSRRGDC